ncbi:PHP domain-containing protein [Gallibacterium anatis]|uniref:DNA polymerase III PolC n=2 Tax=Gallibacterium anatis TaxID=750 RepID=F4HFR2_GALAU|nr:PHP domain-containing protein [Gallibacterium anatis]AEC18265.1 DNA polymerase III PolC [Gallibacterium anatis UMN179]KGQ31690.1 S-adenosylmethionine tRNA ribosyltransferase [Gallibacterium anatis]KGQ44802.1 S-adenosylmethionine tRNA ribosyltransferase [Gallibacterium anatis]KGQ50742.1 S-adenosylmethionine tRNA ribosyltransferase [Gallibacterium anatis 10672-6]KGQ66496.1 S-adenosylmethionine tRNA ribosyltransferase [Gallibacterium anatis]
MQKLSQISATKIDLHSHSNASDGVLSPTALISRAKEQGIEVLALTDHDTVDGIAEAKTAAQQQQITLISGVEISTVWQGKTIHIVGLDFDETHPAMTELLQRQAQLRYARAVEIGERFKKFGLENAFAEAQALTSGEVTRAHYARYLVNIGMVSNEGQAFKRYLSQGKPCYVKANWCDIPTAIEVIHQAGGIAVVAHPMRYQMTNNKIRTLIEDFQQWGGDAVEIAGGVDHNQQKMLIQWLDKLSLSASVGSDFHYPCGWIELGKNLTIPENVKTVWQR